MLKQKILIHILKSNDTKKGMHYLLHELLCKNNDKGSRNL